MRIAPHILALILLVSCKQVDNNINNHPERDSNTTISTEKSASTITTLTKNTSNKIVLIGIIPENYTELKESPANGRKMERIIVDLDNDEKADTAFIVQNENDFVNYLLLVYLTSLNKTYHLKLIDNFSPDFNLFPVQMELRKNVLEVGYFRDGTAAFGRFFKFRFDEKKKNLRLIGYDNGYRSGAAEHCDKSYNLISGMYTVSFAKSIPSNHTETFRGKKITGAIYIDNIDIKTLDKLDKIGSEFENK